MKQLGASLAPSPLDGMLDHLRRATLKIFSIFKPLNLSRTRGALWTPAKYGRSSELFGPGPNP